MQDGSLERVRALIREALDDCPAILCREQRYADFVRQALAKDAVADHLVRALAGAGVLRSLEAPERRKRA